MSDLVVNPEDRFSRVAAHKCIAFYRLQSYVRKTRTIQIDSAKVTYIAADRDVKIYSDTSSNGIKRNTKNVSMNEERKKIFVSNFNIFLFQPKFVNLLPCSKYVVKPILSFKSYFKILILQVAFYLCHLIALVHIIA